MVSAITLPRKKAPCNVVTLAGPRTTWPKSEAIPATVDDALARGWTVTNDDITHDDGSERSYTGIYTMTKRIGRRELKLTIPYEAKFTFRKPRGFKAYALRRVIVMPGPALLAETGRAAKAGNR